MNPYFQVVISDSGTFLKLIPGAGGLPSIQETMNYLEAKKVPFDIGVLGAFFKQGDPEKLIPLSRNRIYAIPESGIIRISEDKMSATVRYYPPSTGGKAITKEDIYSECRLAKIAYGIDEAVIDDFLSNKKYATDYVIAKGKPVVEGKDASIEYHFNVDNDDYYLNLKHNKWTSNNQTSTKSFLDLYDEVTNKASVIINELYDYIFNDKKVNIKSIIKNLDYGTGLEIE